MKILLPLIAILFITSCQFGHVIPIVQGNLIFEQDINKVTVGMSRLEVESIIGEPLTPNLTPDVWQYYYYNKTENKNYESLIPGKTKDSKLVTKAKVFFLSDIVTKIDFTTDRIVIELD